MARFTRRRYVRRSRGGRGKYRSRRRSRLFPRRRNAKSSLRVHRYIRSIEGNFAPNAIGTGNWTSSSGQFALAPAVGSSLDPPNTATGLLNYGGGATFNVGWSNGISELQALYDQYKIAKVKITLLCNWQMPQFGLDASNSSTVAGAAPPAAPQIRWYFDADDSTIPSSVTMEEFAQRPGVRRKLLGNMKPYSFVLRPRMTMAADNGSGGQTNMAIVKPSWINFSNTAVPHHGLKFALLDMPNIGPYNSSIWTKPFIRWRVDYTILCKDPR